jgi:acetylornithine deacetylase/succinyl-diaminopimelate desuccinylase-like protein
VARRSLVITAPTAIVGAVLTALSMAVAAQTSSDSAIQTYVTGNQQSIVGELLDLVAIPNTRTDKADLRRNAALLQTMINRRGLSAEVIETAGAPLVVASLDVPKPQGTLLFYAHYDGQPVDASQWKQTSPFAPILRDGRVEDAAKEIPNLRSISKFDPQWRIYARSVSDDKAPIVALLTAIDALKSSNRTPAWNIRLLLDGEEESSSESLTRVLPDLRNRLKSDLMLFLDGPLHPTGRPTLAFGVRGSIGLQLTVYGPKTELHSGHYGNWVPNPATRLVRLLASMKDDNDRVVIAGFYDGIAPLTTDEQAALKAVPDDAEGLLKRFGIARPDTASLQDALQRPSLNIRGLSSAFVGTNTTNVIPATAEASIDVRLVQETRAQAMIEKIRAHIRARGFHIVDADPDDATRARYRDIVKITASGITEGYRTSLSSAPSRRVTTALTREFGAAPVQIRTMGGTLPVDDLTSVLNVPAIVVPTVNFDNNQHSHNENVRIEDFFRSIRTMAALLTMP